MADEPAADEATDTVRVWLVERTYSDDAPCELRSHGPRLATLDEKQNLIILVYATTDGERYLRKERALTGFGDDRPATAAIEASPDDLGTVDDPETRERYAAEASRLADEHAPDDYV
jgi:hypothetical protein